MPIIQDPTQFDSDELIPQRTDVPIQSKTFNVHMGYAQDGGSGGFVTPSRLDTDETVLDDIDSPDSMFARESIESKEDVDWVCVRFAFVGNLNLDW